MVGFAGGSIEKVGAFGFGGSFVSNTCIGTGTDEPCAVEECVGRWDSLGCLCECVVKFDIRGRPFNPSLENEPERIPVVWKDLLA